MKKFFTVLAFTMTVAANVSAASLVGQCVGPKTKVAKNGYLEFQHPVYLYSAPDASSNKVLLKFAASAFSIAKESNGFIQLKGVMGGDVEPDPDTGKILGWGLRSDFVFQALRNCN